MNLAPRDRRLLLITASLAIAAGVAVAVAIVLVRSTDTTPKQYRPFRIGREDTLSDEIRLHGPICVPDPRRGTRGFCMAIIDGRLAAVHVLVPGQANCSLRLDRRRGALRDCRNQIVDPHMLARFAVTIAKGVVSVDLRQLIPPLTTSPPTTSAPTATTATTAARS